MVRFRYWPMVIALALAAGCQPPAAAPTSGQATAGAVTSAELGKIGLAFASWEAFNKKGPTSAADLKPFLNDTAIDRDAWQKLNAGEVVFLWNASTKAMTAGPSNTVLAYAKAVPTAGGLVLFGSGEVRTLSSAEFAKAALAKAP